MKLLRFGPKGREKPGILDKNGVIQDIHTNPMGEDRDFSQTLTALDKLG